MFKIPPIRAAWRRYSSALVIIAGATAIRMMLTPELGDRAPFLTFYPAVTFAALIGGRGPGFLTTVLSIIIAAAFWFEPSGMSLLKHPAAGVGTIIFFLSAITITCIADAMHSAYSRLNATLRDLKRANSQLQNEIEERKLMEMELAAARETAESANRAKDRFLATLSHELRTPLTPALMIAGAGERSLHLPPEVREDFATIRSNIDLEARIIDDLLDVTRITQNKLQIKLQLCDAHSLLRSSETILHNDIKGKQLIVTHELKAAEFGIHGDPVRLQQVFWNVLKNAVKFTPSGGRIAIRTYNVGDIFHLTITDTGIGIRAHDLPHIFDAFTQAGEATAPHFGGLGLGLTISAYLVQKHGGRIWAESPGIKQGATFHVELPLASPELSDVTPEASPEHITPIYLRILLVEDHEPTRQTLAKLLRRRGHAVEGAGNSAEARILAQTNTFDLMLSDLGLPDGSGCALMGELQREHGLPGIALSGYGMEADIRQSIAAGFREHITKPVDMPTLEQAIARVLHQRSNAGTPPRALAASF